MRRLLSAFFLILFFGIPLLCYVFLDQLYVKRFHDFSNKWYARETQHLRAQDQSLSELLKRYEDVVSVSDDLKGFGIAKGGRVAESFGEAGPGLSSGLPLGDGEIYVQRIGFLAYRTMVMVDTKDATLVFFNFQDDTAFYDFLILLVAMFSILLVALFARARLSKLKEETIQQTTIRTIQGMAHDFRAPFGKLRIFMTQLERLDSPALVQLKSNREALDAAVDHADDILTDVLSMDGKTQATAFETASVAQRLETKYFASWRDEHAQVMLRFECEPNVWALGNEHKTLRVLFNLLDNALKHARSQVTLVIKKHDGGVLFCIKNDGAAIPKNHLKAIFRPFYSKRQGGLGLGLFICQTFVRAQGGELKCTSEEDNTQFFFSLPAASPPAAVRDSAAPKAINARLSIAYVDDEKFYRDALEATLAQSKISVRTFNDTDSLLMELRKGESTFDLLLVDRFGPNFDAVDDRFVESCRDFGYEGPIVLYSNSVTTGTELGGFTKVMDKTKSISADDIMNIIGDRADEKK